MPSFTSYTRANHQHKLTVKDLEIYVNEYSRSMSIEDLYSIITTLGKIKQRSLQSRRLVNFLKRRMLLIKKEAKLHSSSYKKSFSPCEKIIVAFLRDICVNCCNHSLVSICSKLLVRLGYDMYVNEKRFKYKVYRMNLSNNSNLSELLKSVDYEYTEDDELSSDSDDYSSEGESNNKLLDSEQNTTSNLLQSSVDDLSIPSCKEETPYCISNEHQMLSIEELSSLFRDKLQKAITKEVCDIVSENILHILREEAQRVLSDESHGMYSEESRTMVKEICQGVYQRLDQYRKDHLLSMNQNRLPNLSSSDSSLSSSSCNSLSASSSLVSRLEQENSVIFTNLPVYSMNSTSCYSENNENSQRH